MTQPRVTTVVRAYNRREKALRALESALAQSLRDQPVILVDDASGDGTAEAVHARHGTRVRVIRHARNKGPGAAANSGLHAADTPFVAFLDSDDLWHPDYLALMLKGFETAPGIALTYCGCRFLYEAYDLDRPMAFPDTDMVETKLRAPPNTMSVMTARTETLKAIGGFSESVRISDDYDAVVRLWLRAPKSFVHVPHFLVEHRIEDDNITHATDALLSDMHHLTDGYLKHPAFRHLRDQRREILRQPALGIAARHHIAKWLAAEPSRRISLIIFAAANGAGLTAQLQSAADQRLPPVDVAILVPDGVDPANAADGDWPFVVRTIPLPKTTERAPYRKAQGIRLALAALTGDFIAFLEPGHRFADGALDLHRRAHSATATRTAFTYGGCAGRPRATALPLRLVDLAHVALLTGTPGTLSAMTVSRKALARWGGVPDCPDGVLWFALALRLAVEGATAVRSRVPVYEAGADAAANDGPSLADYALCLRDAAETDPGRPLSALSDAVSAGNMADGPAGLVAAGALPGLPVLDPTW